VNGVVRVRGEVSSPPPITLRNRQLAVLLSADPDAPTVEQLAAFNFDGAEPVPVAALDIESPLRAYALMPVRARGDFALQLQRYPNSARAKLERYAVVDYPIDADLGRALEALRADPRVLAASELPRVEMPGLGSVSTPVPLFPPNLGKSAAVQYHFGALGISQLWERAGGWSLLGFVDTGLAVDHHDLRSFTGSNSQSGSYTGGNYLPAFAYDFGLLDSNVDEAEPVPNFPALPVPAYCDTDADGLMEPTYVGHGTHVASLAASNSSNSDGIDGICRRCGIAMMKFMRSYCGIDPSLPGGGTSVFSEPTDAAAYAGFLTAAQFGSQVINMSFGLRVVTNSFYCTVNDEEYANEPFCLMLEFAAENDVIVAAASGNQRNEILFSASDMRVAAVGGIDESLQFWDEDPNNQGDCPLFPDDVNECGSNYSQSASGVPKQEVVLPARGVLASIYPGKDYNDRITCGDSHGAYSGATSSDGIGTCTGTSMSAPQLAGIYGVLRSINPLVPAGDPENAGVYGIRDVVVDTTDRSLESIAWDQKLGYGMPVPSIAASWMLGTIRGIVARNRTTPLFAVYSATAQDYAALASPQAANALIRYQTASYASTGSFIEGESITGYSHFPLLGSGGPSHVARARAHILTTEYSRQDDLPPIVPLYLLDRSRKWPINCSSKSPPCNELNRDFALASSVADLEAAVNGSFAFKGIQGYIYARCESEPGCIPAAAERLYQQCNTSTDDCAVFLERDRSTFEAAGYLALAPFSTSAVLGYAYSDDDSDADGLVDGMEQVIGTDPLSADSDGDGDADAVEYPLAAVPFGDPCHGGSLVTCLVADSVVFIDGFE
jgi:subtilisin family serine protease